MSYDVVVVTGAAGAIGKAICTRLLADGWDVIGADTRFPDAGEEHDDGGCREPVMITRRCDVASRSDVARFWSAVSHREVRALVNAAGIFPREHALDINEADWRSVIDVNLSGAFFMAQEAIRRFLSLGGPGRIVSIASGQAYVPTQVGAHYAASKAAILNLGRALAMEFGPRGITVNTVVPGLVDTPQPRAYMGDEDFERAAATIPMRRVGRPEDVAGLTSFLLSADAEYITGQAIAVNGGAVMIG